MGPVARALLSFVFLVGLLAVKEVWDVLWPAVRDGLRVRMARRRAARAIRPPKPPSATARIVAPPDDDAP